MEKSWRKNLGTEQVPMSCFRCGKIGHFAAQCQADVAAILEQEELQTKFQMGELDADGEYYSEQMAIWEASQVGAMCGDELDAEEEQ